MPELPELEAFVIAQREALTAEPIAAVPVAHFATTKTIDPPLASLAGQRFTAVGRRAKRLLFTAQDGNTLQVHLMSAGRLAVGAKRLKTAMLVVQFESGRELMMSESGHKRRAGVWLLRPDALAAELAHIGPEPLDPAFTPAALAETLQAHPHQLHAFLRDQRAIAGIGRAFANEILHAAMLSPYQRSATLPDAERGAPARRDHGRPRRRGAAAGAAIRERPHDQGRPRLRRPRPARRALPALRRGDPARVVRRAHRLLLPALPDRRSHPGRPAAVTPVTGVNSGGRGTMRVMLESSTFTHDLQATEPDVHLALTRAGVTGVDKVIRIAHAGTELLYYAQIDCFVDLDPSQKGVHMSRFPETVAECIDQVVIGEALHVEDLAEHMAAEDCRASERRALRGHDPGEVPDHPAHARVRPAHAGDLPR